MNILAKFTVSCALTYLAFGGSIKRSTVKEGYSATYSDASEWSYDPGSDYNSNSGSNDYSGSYYEYSHTTYSEPNNYYGSHHDYRHTTYSEPNNYSGNYYGHSHTTNRDYSS